MKAHRPIDLSEFDKNFFSGENDEGIENEERTGSVFTDIGEVSDPSVSLHPSLTPDVVEALMNIKASETSSVFHDLPQDEDIPSAQEGEKSGEAEKAELVSEEEALASFPDFDYDPSIFENAENAGENVGQSGEHISEKNELRLHKKMAKQEIKDEKKRLKERKKLERTVQKPFKEKKLLTLLTVFFVIIGMLGTAFIVLLYKTGNTPETALDIGEYSLCYIDGINIKSTEIKKALVLLKSETVSSNKIIVYRSEGSAAAENVIAIGDGICAVVVSQKIISVKNEDIKGVVYFCLKNIDTVYSLAHNDPVTAFAGVGVYFIVVIALFSLLIYIKNKRIKKYREDYQLVG